MKKWIPVWAIFGVILLSVGTVWLRLTIVRTTYSINQANRNLQNLQQEMSHAEVRMAALKSPKKLELLAKTKFGLGIPKPEQVVYLK